MDAAAVAAAVVIGAFIWPTAITRRNTKQRIKVNTINKHTAVIQVRLFVVVVIESAHEHTLQNIAVFSGTPHARNNNALIKKN